jgi:hypothetical protein
MRRSVLLRRMRTMMLLWCLRVFGLSSRYGLHEEEEEEREDAREEEDLDADRELPCRESVRPLRREAADEVDEVRVLVFFFLVGVRVLPTAWSLDGEGVTALMDRLARACVALAPARFSPEGTLTRSALWLRRFWSRAGRLLERARCGSTVRDRLSEPLSAEKFPEAAAALVRLEVTAPKALLASVAKPPLERTAAFGSTRLRERLLEERRATRRRAVGLALARGSFLLSSENV